MILLNRIPTAFRNTVLLVAMLSATSALAEGVAVKVRDGAEHMIDVSNEHLAITIDLASGARLGRYLYKGFNDRDIIFDYASGNGGMCKDLWALQGWPGEFKTRRYDVEIVSGGPNEAIVKTWTLSTGNYKGQNKSEIAGIRLEKTYILRRGERALTVRWRFTNQTEQGKRAAYWSQHAVDFDGLRKHNIYWRPTRHGVDWIDDEHRVSACNYWYTAPVTAGWNGVTNAKLKQGLMFLFDYNYLQQVYDNTAATTVEWMYDDVAIPAGKTWETEVTLVPTEGFTGYSHADTDVIGRAELSTTPAGVRIDHVLTAAKQSLSDVRIKAELHGVREPWQVAIEEVDVGAVGFAPWSATSHATGIGSLPCVIKVTITGKRADGSSFSSQYADYYGGDAGRNLDLATLEPMHEFAAPQKQKTYLKPDVIALKPNAKPKILFVRGLWAGFHGVDEAIKKLGNVTVVNGWMNRTALGETAGNFPGSYDDLLSYDVMILANMSGPMLGGVGQEMAADFVKAGGGLLVLSGDRTYGQAMFSNPNFVDLLPVTCGPPGDYSRLTGQGKLELNDSHTITQGCTFTAAPQVKYAHQVTAKANAKTILGIDGERPAMVISPSDKERVATVLALPFGKADDGRKLYWQTDAWQQLMANTLTWLARRD